MQSAQLSYLGIGDEAFEARIVTCLELAPVPSIFVDPQMTIRIANRLAGELLKRGDLHGLSLRTIAKNPEILNGLSNVFEVELLAGEETISAELHCRTVSGTGTVISIIDMTQRRLNERSALASERQRLKVQRTEALERLAGGVAHEFNNYLAVVLLQTDMINLQLGEDSPLVSRVNEIKAVTNDAAAIVRQLLAFGRRQSMNPVPVTLNSVFESCGRDLRALLGDRIAVVMDLDPELGVCFIDPSQFAQAIMYLALNAKEAMPDGGELQIRTANIAHGGTLVHRTQTSGAYIEIEVRDNGTGMDTKTAEHAFEPFLSSKGSARSTGMGLATVYGIVKQCGGFIWMSTVRGEGTTFKIQFPRIDEVKSKTAGRGVKKELTTVLLIDDDAAIRRLAAEALRSGGYRVLEAASGADAVETARVFPDQIDVVLADHSMPNMTGPEAVEQIRRMHSAAKALYMSGDPGLLEGTERSIAKPFAMSELITKVSSLIEG